MEEQWGRWDSNPHAFQHHAEPVSTGINTVEL